MMRGGKLNDKPQLYDLLKHSQISILFYPFSLFSLFCLSFSPVLTICICQLTLWSDPPPPYDTFMTPWDRLPLWGVSWYVNGPLLYYVTRSGLVWMPYWIEMGNNSVKMVFTLKMLDFGWNYICYISKEYISQIFKC